MSDGRPAEERSPTTGSSSADTPSAADEQHRRYLHGHRANPLTTTRLGGRLLSASQLFWFSFLPPNGYGVLTTTGRKTGKARRRCVRAVRHGNTFYVVSLRGVHAAWMHNLRADPNVSYGSNAGGLPGMPA